MKRFLKGHQQWILVGCAMLFLLIIVGFYAWGIQGIIMNMANTLGPEAPLGSELDLRLDAAKRILRERGLTP